MNQIINGGKRKTRKVNKSFKAWVTFVKKVQKLLLLFLSKTKLLKSN